MSTLTRAPGPGQFAALRTQAEAAAQAIDQSFRDLPRTAPASHVNPGDRIHDGRRWLLVTAVHPNGPDLRLTYVYPDGDRFSLRVVAPSHPLVIWPALAALEARVEVTWPGSQWRDPETVTGTVVGHHHDGIDIRMDSDGDTVTLFDRDLAPDRATLTVL